MIVRWGALKRANGLSRQQFASEWLDQHVPLVQHAPGLRDYRQNVVIDAAQRSPFPRGNDEFDGFAQLEFDSLVDMRGTMEAVRADPDIDIAHFARETSTFATVRKLDKAPPVGEHFVKRISLLKRSERTSPAVFQHEWWGEHSRLVTEMGGFEGYAQHLVIDNIPGEAKPGNVIPFDGVVEFWFANTEAMRQFYASAAFTDVAAQGDEFIGEITTYLVDEHHAEVGLVDRGRE